MSVPDLTLWKRVSQESKCTKKMKDTPIYQIFPRCLEENVHVYSHKVEEVKPVTNQKSSGRCWLFAALNVARQPFVKHYNLEDFEFSQAHLFYWDKIERANYFLQNISESRRRL